MSGFKNSSEGDTYDDDGVSLFHIKGTDETNVVGVQTAEAASSPQQRIFVLAAHARLQLARQGRHGGGGRERRQDRQDEPLQRPRHGGAGARSWAWPRARSLRSSGTVGRERRVRRGAGRGAAAHGAALFHLTNKFGAFQVEEILDFTQGTCSTMT